MAALCHCKASLVRTLRYLHKWLALLVFLQLLLWMFSGLVISLVDAGIARGSATLQVAEPLSLVGAAPLPLDELDFPETLESLGLVTVDGVPVYRVAGPNGVSLMDSQTGEVFTVDAERASRLARASYRGDGLINEVEFLAQPPALINSEGSAWRIGFGDKLDTDVYVDAADGRVLGHRNSRSAWVEFLLKLHFMDYTGGHDFNHPLIIALAVLALWLAASGALLLIGSLRRVGLR